MVVVCLVDADMLYYMRGIFRNMGKSVSSNGQCFFSDLDDCACFISDDKIAQCLAVFCSCCAFATAYIVLVFTADAENEALSRRLRF